MKKYLYLLALLAFASCEKEVSPYIDMNDELYIGYWKQTSYTDTTQKFTRTVDLANDAFGIAILANGRFLENKNSGWCGTPPIHYAKYEGTWLENGIDTLLINTQFWGGNMKYRIIIKSVDEEKLEAKLEYLDVGG